MNKKIKSVLSGAIAATLALGSSVVPAFAAAGGTSNVGPAGDASAVQGNKHHPNSNDMGVWVDKDKNGIEKGGTVYNKVVTPLGKNAFYRIKNYTETAAATGTAAPGVTQHIVEYATGDDKSTSDANDVWHAIPSAYVNDGFALDSEFGAYVIENGEKGQPEVIFVKLVDCVKDNAGNYTWNHATADGALVSGTVDQATSLDPHMGTDFYIRVEDRDDDTTERVEPSNRVADNWVDYDIDTAVITKYKMQATIPMYVCMYGYRGSGEVVTPKKEQYVMKNYSAVNYGEGAYIKDVVKNTIYTQVLDANHTFENIHTIVYAEDKDAYVWFYSKPSIDEINKALKAAGSTTVLKGGEDVIYTFDRDADGKVGNGEEFITASGESYVYFDAAARKWNFKASGVLQDIVRDGKIYKGTRESFMVPGADGSMVPGVDPKHPLKTPFVHTTVIGNGSGESITYDFTTTPKVGDKSTSAQAKDEALAINVTQLAAAPASWKLVDYSTQNMKAGEIGMKIAPDFANKDVSAIDLSKCSAPMDITARGWNVPAPKMKSDNTVDMTKPGELPLITMARMAGHNVNPVGCTQVVHVEYTIGAREDINNPQINTDAGIGTDVDHLPETPIAK